MSDFSLPADEADLLLLLDRYQELRLQGKNPSVGELCADTPRLVEPLQKLIDAKAHLARVGTECDTRQTLSPPGLGETITQEAGTSDANFVPTLARYEVLARLGEGGMGAVYRARDRLLGREVALKVIRPEKMTWKMRQRFTAEARAVAALDHPNIMKVFDVGEWTSPEGGPTPYLALEFVPGAGLSAHLGRGPMAPAEAARLVRLLTRAMAHAHGRGVIHRDLKPDNVLLGPAVEPSLSCGLGCPKIGDFGLARQEEPGNDRLTRTGAVMGTPAYMAPEQADGLPDIGPPADVYALGVLLYRLLAGNVPFEGTSAVEVLFRVIREAPVPLCQVQPHIPAELEALCLECLRKNPAERPTAADLASRLERFLGPVNRDVEEGSTMSLPGVPTVARPERRRQWVGLALLGVVVLVAATFTTAWWNRAHGDADPERQAEAPPALPTERALAIEPLKVAHFATLGKEAERRGQIGVDSPGARWGDRVTLTVRLNQPGYFYVVGFNFNGEEQLLWPLGKDGLPSATLAPPQRERAQIPEGGINLALEEDNATQGLQAYAVLAARQPLPAYAEWRAGRAKAPWARYPAGAWVWQADCDGVYPVVLGKITDRGGFKTALPVKDEPPLAELCRALRVNGVEAVELLAFGVQAKEGGQ